MLMKKTQQSVVLSARISSDFFLTLGFVTVSSSMTGSTRILRRTGASQWLILYSTTTQRYTIKKKKKNSNRPQSCRWKDGQQKWKIVICSLLTPLKSPLFSSAPLIGPSLSCGTFTFPAFAPTTARSPTRDECFLTTTRAFLTFSTRLKNTNALGMDSLTQYYRPGSATAVSVLCFFFFFSEFRVMN